MALAPAVVKQLARIGASVPNPSTGDAVAALVHEVAWPGGTFARRPGTDGPLVCGFRFLPPNSRGRFWDGWERDFARVDPARLYPLASDDYYFYFVSANEGRPSDPVVYCVDHEETDTEPYSGRFHTVSELLLAIVAEGPAE